MKFKGSVVVDSSQPGQATGKTGDFVIIPNKPTEPEKPQGSKACGQSRLYGMFRGDSSRSTPKRKAPSAQPGQEGLAQDKNSDGWTVPIFK